jgi:geranylgeranyl pyrophosphate synthase
MTDHATEVASWRERFEAFLRQQLTDGGEGSASLNEAMRYAALAGGKRFRPVLVFAAGKALGLEPDRLNPVAAAIELIHAYSLIHDDLPAMDDDDLRRGRPTCHRAFGEATAILAGDALQALAFEVLAGRLPGYGAAGLRVIREIAAACGAAGMAGGQALDLAAVGESLNESQLVTMHRLKTGALIRASVTCPCILAGADPDSTARFAAYGDCVGLAFQVHDDILDVAGDSELTGKSTLADAALNKPTFPSIIGLEDSRRRAYQLRDEAISHLQAVTGDVSTLEWLAHYVVSRDR